MKISENKLCFNKNRLKNNIALDGLTSVKHLADKISKLEKLADFSVFDFEDEFEKIVGNGEATDFILNHVQQYASDSRYSPSVASTEFAHLLVNDLCQLYVGFLKPEQTMRNIIFTAPCNFLFAPLSPDSELRVKKYLLPKDWNCEVYDVNAELILTDEYSVFTRQIINVPRNGDCVNSQHDRALSDSYIYDFSVEKPIIWLRLASQATSPYQWVFDKTSLKPSFMSSSAIAHTRYETIIQMISSFHAIGVTNEVYLQALESLTKSPLHHIRWLAAQELFEANQERGISVVKELVDDIHPHVKKAAAGAIIQLQNAGIAT
jgi:hypothetical protein